jgi:hypothetical protein
MLQSLLSSATFRRMVSQLYIESSEAIVNLSQQTSGGWLPAWKQKPHSFPKRETAKINLKNVACFLC